MTINERVAAAIAEKVGDEIAKEIVSRIMKEKHRIKGDPDRLNEWIQVQINLCQQEIDLTLQVCNALMNDGND